MLKKIIIALVLAAIMAVMPAAADTGCQIDLGGGEWASDWDCDGIEDGLDNCPFDYNPDQKDSNGNGIGDACDPNYDEPDEKHPPRFIKSIPDQTIWQGESFAVFDLDDYVYDQDHQNYQLKFYASGNQRLSVHISSSHTVYISYPASFAGDQISELITFTVEDPDGLKDAQSARFTVRKKSVPENQPPTFIKDVQGQIINCEQSFTRINLREYVYDPDDSIYDLEFGYESRYNSFRVSITSTGVAYITHANENADDYITFTVKDPKGAVGKSNAALFRVMGCGVTPPEAPILRGIPGQTVCSSHNFQVFDLGDYTHFTGDWSNLEFSVTGQYRFTVFIGSDNKVRISYPQNFIGAETLTFRVVDKSTGKYDTDSAVFRVRDCEPPTDAPRISGIPDQTIWEGESFEVFSLNDYVSYTGDLRNLVYTVSSNKLTARITSSSDVYITYPTNFAGSETLTFKVVDTSTGKYDTDSAVFTVKRKDKEDEDENRPPRWKAIPDQIIRYGERFEKFNLDHYAYDPDHDNDELEYWAENDYFLKVDIDRRNWVTADYPAGWCGYERIKFVVEDPEGAQATRAVTFKVLCEEYIPPYIPVPPFGPVPIDGGCTVKDLYTGRVLSDWDCDTIPDEMDNCPTVYNPNQWDSNGNGIGDACDLNLLSYTITPSKELGPGQAFVPEILLRNLAQEAIENIVIEVSIPELNIRNSQRISLESGESRAVNLFLRIPECIPEQHLNARLTVYYNVRDTITKSERIHVLQGRCVFDVVEPVSIVDVYSIQDVHLGKSAVYPFQITNDADHDRSYVLSADGVTSWGSYYFDSGSVVVIPSGATRNVNLYITASKDAAPGERTFAVNVRTGPESREILLVANLVKTEKESVYAWMIIALQIVLAALIIFGIVYGITYAAKLKQERDSEKVVKGIEQDKIVYYH